MIVKLKKSKLLVTVMKSWTPMTFPPSGLEQFMLYSSTVFPSPKLLPCWDWPWIGNRPAEGWPSLGPLTAPDLQELSLVLDPAVCLRRAGWGTGLCLLKVCMWLIQPLRICRGHVSFEWRMTLWFAICFFISGTPKPFSNLSALKVQNHCLLPPFAKENQGGACVDIVLFSARGGERVVSVSVSSFERTDQCRQRQRGGLGGGPLWSTLIFSCSSLLVFYLRTWAWNPPRRGSKIKSLLNVVQTKRKQKLQVVVQFSQGRLSQELIMFLSIESCLTHRCSKYFFHLKLHKSNISE